MKGLYFTGTWLTFWIEITPRFCNCVITWSKSVIEHPSVLFCVVEYSPDCIFSVDRRNMQWCQGLGNEIITTYHHIFVIPSHYTDPYRQSISVLYTVCTRKGLKFTTLLSHRRPNADIYCSKKIHCTKNTFGHKNPSVLCRLMFYWWHTLYYSQLNFVAALLNFVGTLPAEPFFRLFDFGVFQKGME